MACRKWSGNSQTPAPAAPLVFWLSAQPGDLYHHLALSDFNLKKSSQIKNENAALCSFKMFSFHFSVTGMSGHKDLVLSKVIHKAFVKVHEKATEATFVDMCWGEFHSGKKSWSNFDLKSFIADHPFLFFIRHNPTMNILFAGRFCCPV